MLYGMRGLTFVAVLMASCATPTAPPDPPPSPDASPAPAPEAEIAPADDVQTVVALMTGSFSSREQAQADPEYFDIRLHMIPIWTEQSDARWLYVEQAVATAPDKPYRQRVYRVSPGDDGQIISAVFTIEEPLRFALAWKDPGKLESLERGAVTQKPGCEVRLTRRGEQHFEGATGERTCSSDLRGASWASSEVKVTAEGVDSWDRGYNDAGEQVWGATKGGYRFRRDDPEAPPVVAPEPGKP